MAAPNEGPKPWELPVRYNDDLPAPEPEAPVEPDEGDDEYLGAADILDDDGGYDEDD